MLLALGLPAAVDLGFTEGLGTCVRTPRQRSEA